MAGTVVTVALVIAAYLWSERQKTTPFAHFTIERATDSDHTSVAAISPDGSYLASVVSGPKGENSLWVRQLATKSDHPILQQPSFQYLGLIFSPDGSYIYFWVNAIGDHTLHHRRDVYRIPTAGGQPTNILQDVDMLPSFIDGGRRLCFERQIVDQDDKAIVYRMLSASASGGEERVMAERKPPYPTVATCAPSGRFAVVQDDSGNLELLDFATGKKRPFVSGTTLEGRLFDARWAPDGKGFFGLREKLAQLRTQLVFVSYPDGTVRQVTADLGDYSGISLTDDARIIATTQLDRHFRFADLSLSDPARMEQRGPQGIEWFSWVDNDRIIASDEDRALKMLVLSRDEITTLGTAAATWYAQPALCGPGTIVSTAINPESGMTLISKMRLDGSAANEVTHGPHDLFPTCASDGKWLYYVHIVDARDVNGTAVMRKPIDGGPAEKIVAGRNYNLSPDGKLLADFPWGDSPTLELLSTETLRPVAMLPWPPHAGSQIAFTPDNKSFYYAIWSEAGETIYRQSIGSFARVKLATLPPGATSTWIRLSLDGKRLGLTTMAPQSKAVLLRETR